MADNYADVDGLELLSRRAREWYSYFEQKSLEAEANFDRQAAAFERAEAGMFEILLEELGAAIQASEEYNIEPLKGHILQVFSQDGMITAPDGVVHINAELAGTNQDFDQGIEHAKEKFDFGNTMDAQAAAEFWKNFIYGPVREGKTILSRNEKTSVRKLAQMQHYYYRTIEGRLEGWADKAPYWYWIDNGNYHSKGAYPRHPKTDFVKKAKRRCQALFDMVFEEVIFEEENLIEDALERFLDNPEVYNPGDILDTFYEQGKDHYIYITQGRGLVGVSARRPG
jgi:hypothetical protein